MYLLDRLAEKRITEAAERGELDNLAGQGEPLDLDDDSLVPEELRSAYRLLRNAGYVPPEISLRREISNIEQLIATAASQEDRSALQGRLRALMLRLRLYGRDTLSLHTEREYFERLSARLNGGRAK